MIRLFELPHRDARRLVASGAPVFLTVNPVEYHGPHLSLHNDRLISLGLARDLHARLAARRPEWPLVVGADLELGVEPCPGAGTRRTPFRQARAAVVEACRALGELGVRRVVLMTFHGAPLHNLAIEAGIQLLAREGVQAVAPFNVVLRELVELDPARFAGPISLAPEAERAALLRELPVDFHAGFFETSMALHYAPASVSPVHRELPPCPPFASVPRLARAARLAGALGARGLARELAFAAVGVGWSELRPFPGYTGRPHLASREVGAAFAELIVGRYVEITEAVFSGRSASPPPIMPWAELVTLGGRLAPAPVPPAGEILSVG